VDSSGTTTYEYDYENRLRKATMPDGTIAEYKYDALGRRIEKAVNGTVTGYLYDREDILAEYDATGAVTTQYIHGAGIDEPLAMERAGQAYYYHADGLGSIAALTDNSGTIVQWYEYDAFGNITNQMNTSFKQPYTYTGREHDPETGLYYYRMRYYDAHIGRFISEDPIGFAGGTVNLYEYVDSVGKPLVGTNLYEYVGNDPINWIDPLGLTKDQPKTIKIKITNPHTFRGYFGVVLTAAGGAAMFAKHPYLMIGGAVAVVIGGYITITDWLTIDQAIEDGKAIKNQLQKTHDELEELNRRLDENPADCSKGGR
jgi:RHS repeat-associated protein